MAKGIGMKIQFEEKLISACGLYCRLCPEYEHFKMGFTESAERLKHLITEMINVDAWPWDVNKTDSIAKFFDFAQFMKGLQWLSAQQAVCKGCASEVVPSSSLLLPGRNPDCKIRSCCFGKGFRFCHECSDFACKELVKLKEHYPCCLRNLERLREVGIEKWLEEQQLKVKTGLTNREP